MTLFCSRSSAARWRRLVLLVPLAFLALTGVASAASFSVNEATDSPLANSAGTTCASATGGCTLRAAVQAADNAGGSSTITLPAGDYKLTIENPSVISEDAPATGDLDVNEGVDLSIVGAGDASTTIDANHIDRAFAVHAKAALAISGVTVENGTQSGDEPSDESIQDGRGGAFYNDGSLSIEASVLTGNSADSGGGVIYAGTEASATSIRSSTVTQNASEDEGGVLDVESGSVTLSGDQITHNSADGDGAVLDDEDAGTVGAVTVSGSTLDHNVGESGGALFLEDAGALNVSESSIDGDLGEDSGGAVFDVDSEPITVTSSSMSHDSSPDVGGAIYAEEDESLTVASSTFENDAAEDGGAIYLFRFSATAVESITTSTFSGNSAGDDDGGAIYDGSGDLQVSRSTFTANSSGFFGGALAYESGDDLSLTNDTFDGNQSGFDGGALYFGTEARIGSSVALLNDTIARNTAYDGGGIYAPDKANTIENTIVADNVGTKESTFGGGDCFEQAGQADKGGNIDSDGSCFGESKAAGDQTGVNPLLGPLANNGGPTETDALLAGSPALGTALGAACPATDQRGVPRAASACDVGAFQPQPADLSVAVAAPASTTQGDAIAYTITVTNNGPGPTGGVTLTDSLPAGTSLYSIGSSQGACSGTSTLTCALGALEDGASATVQVTAIANATGSLTDSASVTGTEADPSTANNSASTTTLVRAFPTSASSTLGTSPTAATAKPQAATGKASEKARTSVAFSATINPEGSATTWHFAIGTSKKKLKRLTETQSAGSGTTPLGVLAIVKGLKPGTRYYVEVVAVNAHGTVDGKIVSFKTTGKAPKKHKKAQHNKKK